MCVNVCRVQCATSRAEETRDKSLPRGDILHIYWIFDAPPPRATRSSSRMGNSCVKFVYQLELPRDADARFSTLKIFKLENGTPNSERGTTAPELCSTHHGNQDSGEHGEQYSVGGPAINQPAPTWKARGAALDDLRAVERSRLARVSYGSPFFRCLLTPRSQEELASS